MREPTPVVGPLTHLKPAMSVVASAVVGVDFVQWSRLVGQVIAQERNSGTLVEVVRTAGILAVWARIVHVQCGTFQR